MEGALRAGCCVQEKILLRATQSTKRAPLDGEAETFAWIGRRCAVLGEPRTRPASFERVCFRECWPFRVSAGMSPVSREYP
jgi:hypothetical protein